MGSFRVLFVKDGSVLKNMWSREKERYREGDLLGSFEYIKAIALVFYCCLHKLSQI